MNRVTFLGIAAIACLLTACTGLNRRHEETLNREAGIEATETDDKNVQIFLPDKALFETDHSDLSPDSSRAIKRSVVLIQRSSKPIVVEGHTDNVGTHAHNQALSEARAKAVADELERNGISGSRITIKGFAYDRPAASNDTPDGRARNRRTEIVIQGESIEAIMGTGRY